MKPIPKISTTKEVLDTIVYYIDNAKSTLSPREKAEKIYSAVEFHLRAARIKDQEEAGLAMQDAAKALEEAFEFIEKSKKRIKELEEILQDMELQLKSQPNKMLTQEEHNALSEIIENGWGDGDYAGYGGEDPEVQLRAMRKFEALKQ
jgi:hypothetical protein